ncbi:MAG: hypothetical protein ACMXYA_02725 [Candidatus Woesearchaeota archaeon]
MKKSPMKFPLRPKERHVKKAYYSHLESILTTPSFKSTHRIKQRDPKKLSAPQTATLVDSLYREKTHTVRNDDFEALVAPRPLIIADIIESSKERILHTNGRTGKQLSVYAVEGHMQSGMGMANKNRTCPKGVEFLQGEYPNTTTSDVLSALEKKLTKQEREQFGLTNDHRSKNYHLTAKKIGPQTQKHIDDFVAIIDDFFASPDKYIQPVELKTPDNNPLFGLDIFKGQKVHFVELLRGLYFGLQMDGEKRDLVQEKFGLEMGRGSHHIVDKSAFARYSLNIDGVATGSYTDEMRLLEDIPHVKRMRVLAELGITHDNPVDISTVAKNQNYSWDFIKQTFGVDTQNLPEHLQGKKIESVYFREKKGKGISDDLAILQTGFLPDTFRDKSYRPTSVDHISRILGAFIADHIDTIHTKSNVLFTGGQDEVLCQYLEHKWKEATKDYDFKQKFQINTKLSNPPLIPDTTLAEFIGMGANYEKGNKGNYDVIHSSQRWFFKELEGENKEKLGTCAVDEYMKMIRHTLRKYDNTQEPFVHTPKGALVNRVNVTFEQIPFPVVQKEYQTRASILAKPSHQRFKAVSEYIQSRSTDSQ